MSTRAADGDGSGSSRKKPRTHGIYQRKRATAACQPCRARKTKCDNVRPSCGFCTEHGAQCIYSNTSNDHSSFDPATLAILERVNYAVSLLEGRPKVPSEHQDAAAEEPVSREAVEHLDAHLTQALHSENDRASEIPEFPPPGNSFESVLKWPIFHESVPEGNSLVLELGNDRTTPSMLGRGIHEEDIIPLSKRFLAYVHVKNPILDVGSFSHLVRDVAETGLRWDGLSCLVLLACALGSISTPFQPHVDSNKQISTQLDTHLPSKETSSAYYAAAKKRLGVIEPSLLSVQCLFLCGVLEMYFINPLRAWHYFTQACVLFRNLLWTQGQVPSIYEEIATTEKRRLEQRLYWSCMKSECELRCEIPLPPSGISRLNFPYVLPSPPTELSSPTNASYTSSAEPEEERSWFYYLAEISFRRMMNRIFTVMTKDGEESWINDLLHVREQQKAFQEQLDTWYSHLPPPINLNLNEGSNNELAHHIRGRALSAQEWIYRPFLYYVVHQPRDAPHMSEAMPLAEKCLDLCVQCLLHLNYSHRHHGTWLVVRTAVTRALLLLAAARSGKIEMPEKWGQVVERALQAAQHWVEEAPDFKRAAAILQRLTENT